MAKLLLVLCAIVATTLANEEVVRATREAQFGGYGQQYPDYDLQFGGHTKTEASATVQRSSGIIGGFGGQGGIVGGLGGQGGHIGGLGGQGGQIGGLGGYGRPGGFGGNRYYRSAPWTNAEAHASAGGYGGFGQNSVRAHASATAGGVQQYPIHNNRYHGYNLY